MQSSAEDENPHQALPIARQVTVVAILAGAALAATVMIFVLRAASDKPPAAPPGPKLATFVPSSQQRAALKIENVGHRIFHTEIVTDGYVAPNGGFAAAGSAIAHGQPILAGQSSDTFQAESDLETASAQYQATAAAERRQHALYESEGAALKDWQQAQVDEATAAAALASARNRLRLLGKTGAAIGALENQVDHLSGNATPVTFTVGGLSTVWLVGNVRENDAALVHLGDQVEVKIPAYPQETFVAAIAYIAPMIDPSTHRLVIGAQIHNSGEALKPNMLATFSILAGEASDAPAVPQNAIISEGDNSRVWVVDGQGNLSLRTVMTGRTSNGYVEITKGLSVGEQIVTAGALFIDQAAKGG